MSGRKIVIVSWFGPTVGSRPTGRRRRPDWKKTKRAYFVVLVRVLLNQRFFCSGDLLD